MKIIIKEFLSMLKESKELDRLLPDLLRSMGIEILYDAQIGIRQDGADIIAAGKYNNKNTFFFITVKQGDIYRNDWHVNKQSIRQSLEEILDKRINKIPKKYNEYNTLIVLASGGDIKPEIEGNWNGFVQNYEKKFDVKFDFWGGDRISEYIIDYMLNENIFSDNSRKLLRKSLSLVGDIDYDLKDFYNLIDYILSTVKKNKSNTYTNKEIIKSIRTIKICLVILFHWSIEEKNIKPAYYAGEYCLLKTWNFIFKNKLNKSKNILIEYRNIFSIINSISQSYLIKISKIINTNGGLTKYCNDSNTFNLLLFEQIGIISTIGLLYYQLFWMLKKDDDLKKEVKRIVNIIKQYLKTIISNYRTTSSPFYDSHMIDIGLALIFLFLLKENDLIDSWIWHISENTTYAFRIGKYFPISTDNFEDLISLNIEESINKTELMKVSTLFPMIAEWAIVLNNENIYKNIQLKQKDYFKECTYQIWYPDQESFDCFYEQNAADFKGYSYAPINLPENMNEYKEIIKGIYNKELKYNELSSRKSGIIGLEFIAHRHFRTPICPSMWQQFIFEEKN